MSSVAPETLAAGLLVERHPGCSVDLDSVSPSRRRDLINCAVRLIAEIEAAGFEVTATEP
jgi:hypothetical protein